MNKITVPSEKPVQSSHHETIVARSFVQHQSLLDQSEVSLKELSHEREKFAVGNSADFVGLLWQSKRLANQKHTYIPWRWIEGVS